MGNVATGIAGDDPDLDAEAVENACVNQTGWDTDFSNRMYTCAIKNGGNAKKGGKCMSETQGVSRDCGRCLGRLMKCSRGSRPCARKCCSGNVATGIAGDDPDLDAEAVENARPRSRTVLEWMLLEALFLRPAVL